MDPLGHRDDGLGQQLELGRTVVDVEWLSEEEADVDCVQRQPAEREHDRHHGRDWRGGKCRREIG